MDKDDLLYLIALLKTEHIGPILAKNIIQFFGSIQEVFKAHKRQFLLIPKIGQKTANDLQNIHKHLTDAENIINRCDKLKIKILSYQSEEYPAILNEIYDPPLILYAKGFISKNLWGIGIVGTRSATDYGKEQTQLLAEYLVNNQIPIISGMAYGIDYQAHKRCVDLKGRTIGVLACGIDTIYPRNHENLATEILLQGGAIISEYPPGTIVHPMNFPLRNRIISGLSKAVIVIESGEQGGALITARYAFEQNRDVWALPGRVSDPKSQGCNALIQNNIAKIYSQPADILEDLKIPTTKNSKTTKPNLFNHLTDQEIKVLQSINSQGIELELLSEKTEIEISILLSTLLSLEVKGLITQLPGKKIVKNGY